MASPILNVNVIADTKKFSSGMNSAIKDTNGLSDGLKKFGIAAGVAAAAATAALTAFSISAIKAASDLQETSAAVGQIFGPAAKSLQDFAKEAPTLLGQTQNEFLNAAKTFGIFGQAAGLAGEENVEFSKELAILATDLASFNNTSTDDAITAIGAALRGESEPIRRYGVLLDDATLKAKALELGIYSGNGALTQQQRVLAANAAIFEQTATQQGDFARTSDGLANGLKVLNAQFDNLKLVLGDALLPIVSSLIPEISKFVQSLTASPAFEEFVQSLATTFQGLFQALVPIMPVLFEIFNALLPPLMQIIEALVPVVLKLVNAFMPLIKAVLPPLADLLLAVIPIIDVLADIIILFVPIITSLVTAFIPLIKSYLPPLLGLLEKLVPAFQAVADIMLFIARNVIKPLVDGVIGLVGWFGDLLGLSGQNVSAPASRFNRPKLAEGGIVMPRPGGVPVTVAEAGQAEAIIPLDKLGSLGGGVNVTVNGNVGWSPEDMANIVLRKQRQAMALAGLNGIVGVR
jgi:hypothetical protein